MKITDTMVLALLKKGIEVKGENVDLDMEMDMPVFVDKQLKVNVKMKIGSYELKIVDQSSEF